jgi:hypothetical protein
LLTPQANRPPVNSEGPEVFIAHAGEAKASFVDMLRVLLCEVHSLDVFVDEWSLRPNDNASALVHQNLRTAAVGELGACPSNVCIACLLATTILLWLSFADMQARQLITCKEGMMAFSHTWLTDAVVVVLSYDFVGSRRSMAEVRQMLQQRDAGGSSQQLCIVLRGIAYEDCRALVPPEYAADLKELLSIQALRSDQACAAPFKAISISHTCAALVHCVMTHAQQFNNKCCLQNIAQRVSLNAVTACYNHRRSNFSMAN